MDLAHFRFWIKPARILSHVFDPSPKASGVIVELKFGEGGDDAKAFVFQLAEAYKKYARRNGLIAEEEIQGDGHTLLTIKGETAPNLFLRESGSHCVQRVPPSEKNGRRHTSMISVAVIPIRMEVSGNSFKESDVEIIFQRGHGAGGQHRNKTESSVRATHLPTGLKVFINQGREQHQNRRIALEILCAKVEARAAAEKTQKEQEQRRRLLGNGGRSFKIRTYNFIHSHAADHRNGVKTSRVSEVMEGRFELLG